MYARQHRILEALTGALDDYEAGAIDLKQLAEDFNGLLNPPAAAPPRPPGVGMERRTDMVERVDRVERVEPSAGRVVSWVVYSNSGMPAAEPERGRVATFFTRTFKRH